MLFFQLSQNAKVFNQTVTAEKNLIDAESPVG
jgi:hypothetical protein